MRDLRERNRYGEMSGMKVSEMKVAHPEQVAKLGNDPLACADDGEEYGDFRKRVVAAFVELTKTDVENICIISHGGVLRCLLKELLGLGEFGHLADFAVVCLESDNGEVMLRNIENSFL